MKTIDNIDKAMTKEDLKKLADNMQLQVASFSVTIPEPPTSHSELPKFMQVLIDALVEVHITLREIGCEAIAMKAVKFTPSVIAPDSGRGELEIHVIRAKTVQPVLNSLN
jgi:hypothetical protein